MILTVVFDVTPWMKAKDVYFYNEESNSFNPPSDTKRYRATIEIPDIVPVEEAKVVGVTEVIDDAERGGKSAE